MVCIQYTFGRGITKYTVIHGVSTRFWPSLPVCVLPAGMAERHRDGALHWFTFRVLEHTLQVHLLYLLIHSHGARRQRPVKLLLVSHAIRAALVPNTLVSHGIGGQRFFQLLLVSYCVRGQHFFQVFLASCGVE